MIATPTADGLGVPLVRGVVHGAPIAQGLGYGAQGVEGDEVEDLVRLLLEVKARFPEVQAVCSGAILSTYQRLRVESVCYRLGLTSLAYLWQRDQVRRLAAHSCVCSARSVLLLCDLCVCGTLT